MARRIITPDGRVFSDVVNELERVREKFPQTDACPNGTSSRRWKSLADTARDVCDRADRNGLLTFAHIFDEESLEVLAEEDDAKLRGELVQVMAVCTRWIRAIDRRTREVTDAQSQEAHSEDPQAQDRSREAESHGIPESDEEDDN